jgi:hypothetical protein
MSATVQVSVNGVGGIACPIEVRAQLRRGTWTVTPFLNTHYEPVAGSWVVTHAPSGVKVSGPFSLAQAKRLCKLLGARHADFGQRARFGVVPRKRSSARWMAVHATYNEWKRDEGLL